MSASSDENLKATIFDFCQTLSRNDLETPLKLCTGDITLSWGPYEFIGRERVKRWIVELRELFPILSFKEKSLKIQGNIARQEIIFAFIMEAGHEGWLPCVAVYEFDDGLIKRINFQVLDGVLKFIREGSNIYL